MFAARQLSFKNTTVFAALHSETLKHTKYIVISQKTAVCSAAPHQLRHTAAVVVGARHAGDVAVGLGRTVRLQSVADANAAVLFDEREVARRAHARPVAS